VNNTLDLNVLARECDPYTWDSRYRSNEYIGLQALVIKYLDQLLSKEETLSSWDSALTDSMVACELVGPGRFSLAKGAMSAPTYLQLFSDAANDVLSSSRVYEKLEPMVIKNLA
jgi:hypothetical protein